MSADIYNDNFACHICRIYAPDLCLDHDPAVIYVKKVEQFRQQRYQELRQIAMQKIINSALGINIEDNLTNLTEKVCVKCCTIKSIHCFKPDKRTVDGYISTCKECVQARWTGYRYY